MQALKTISNILSTSCRKPMPILAFRKVKIVSSHRTVGYHTRAVAKSKPASRYYHEDIHDVENEINAEAMYKEQPVSVKNILYPETDDPLIERLNSTASLQEIFDFLKRYDKILDHRHLAQSVLVLWDLQKMFCHINVISNVTRVDSLMKDYVSQLVGRDEFELLLQLIQEKIEEFDLESLTCTLLYLSKIGVSADHQCIQAMIERARRLLREDGKISLTAASRYLVAVFSRENTSGFFVCQDLIPRIFSQIDKCETADDLKLVTICLNNLNRIVTQEILDNYKKKVKELIDSGKINKDEPSAILKIILFLNFPHWREGNVTLMSECMSLLKDTLNQLNVYEILILYETFYKIQEPAHILNDIQRCAYKFLHQLEEESSPLLDIRLKLLSCIVCFSSPAQRPQFESTMRKYMDHKMSGDNLLQLFKVLHFLKNSDANLCRSYWDKLLNVMEHDTPFKETNLLKICHHYMNFSQNVNYRHLKFEKRLNHWLEGEIEQGMSNYVPARFASVVSFLIAYGKDVSFLNHCVNKLDEIWEQLNYVDCSNLSKGLQIGTEFAKNLNLKKRTVDQINSILNRCIQQAITTKMNINELNMWLKGCIYRNKFHGEIIPKLLSNYENLDITSSTLIKSVTYCLSSTNTLLPDVMDTMVDYVCEYNNNMLAFNIENVAYLCYETGYRPKRHRQFFKVLQDVLLRDQERLSGLSYLQSCLALCYFNCMTATFIRQVFNTSFLEKLDTELINCYSKDVYPLRVRHRLMELNRTICIDYPECNVPWFHQKYVEDLNKKDLTERGENFTFRDKISDYLDRIYEKPASVKKNVVTPYGYHIDYVVQPELSDKGLNFSSKIAVLLLRPKAFTKLNVQLKGYYQQKIRHLEMFGYRVAVLNMSEWRNLVCGEDRVNFLSEVTSPRIVYFKACEVNR